MKQGFFGLAIGLAIGTTLAAGAAFAIGGQRAAVTAPDTTVGFASHVTMPTASVPATWTMPVVGSHDATEPIHARVRKTTPAKHAQKPAATRSVTAPKHDVQHDVQHDADHADIMIGTESAHSGMHQDETGHMAGHNGMTHN